MSLSFQHQHYNESGEVVQSMDDFFSLFSRILRVK